MHLECNNLGKRFAKEWIYKSFSYSFNPGNAYAIIGANGSGKSTLMRSLIGQLPTTTGQILYGKDHSSKSPTFYKHTAFAAPYLDLIEEFSLKEHIEFHFKFKAINSNTKVDDIPKLLQLNGHEDKTIKAFSSGMKQRLKSGLALLTDSPLLFLDEPGTNLDEAGKNWLRDMILEYTENRITIIASNEQQEIALCSNIIPISDYKP